MATKEAVTTIGSLLAGESLVAAQFKFGNVNSAGAVIKATAGGRVAGVIANTPASGEIVELEVAGVSKVEAGGSVTAGDGVAADSAGDAVTATGSAFVAGIALDSASDGERFRVLHGHPAVGFGASLESLAAPGTINPAIAETFLSIDGTDPYTMAVGTYVGQRKTIEVIAAVNTPVAAVTIADAYGSEPTVYTFTALGQRVTWEWHAGGSAALTGWKVIEFRAAGTDTPAAASTLNMLVGLHVLAISGTMDWVLPSGVVPGQMQRFKVASAAAIPAGTVSGLFYDEDGSADGVDIVVDAAADMATVVWDGARWDPIQLVSATIA